MSVKWKWEIPSFRCLKETGAADQQAPVSGTNWIPSSFLPMPNSRTGSAPLPLTSHGLPSEQEGSRKHYNTSFLLFCWGGKGVGGVASAKDPKLCISVCMCPGSAAAGQVWNPSDRSFQTLEQRLGSARLKKTAVTAAVCPSHPALARPHPCQFSAVPQAPCRAVGSLGLQTATDAIKTITPGALWEKFTLVGKFSVGRMWVLVAS